MVNSVQFCFISGNVRVKKNPQIGFVAKKASSFMQKFPLKKETQVGNKCETFKYVFIYTYSMYGKKDE